MSERIALIHAPADRVEAYLPDNYQVTEESSDSCVIRGEDRAGWTLDGYVLPRLQSGLIWGEEVTGEVPPPDRPEFPGL